MKYFPPVPTPTGSISGQTRAEQTNSSWHFGPRYESYFQTEFLDAPETIPSGGVRAVDFGGDLTIGVDYVWRESRVAS